MPGLGVQHQREQAQRLGLVRQQRHDEAAEPERFLGQVATRRIEPATGECGVDRCQHGIQPLRHLGALRNAQGNARLPDLRLRPHQPLAHRGRGDQEGRRDRRGVEAKDRLHHQRRPDGGIDRRMGAGEHQRQAFVGDSRIVHRLVQFLSQQAEMIGRLATRAAAAGGIDQPAPPDRGQPCLRIARDAGYGPVDQRGRKRIRKRVLGRGHVAGARRQEGNQLPIAAARHGLRQLGGGRHHMVQIGRTSIAP